ncbi:MAG: hypothetical protein QNJ60_12155 [Xenococcaceae cyanobacterium MO_188.B19]|nr:hypothetical protein [Xenococcaceae cyanobacterium MO_188.B19]
MVKIKTQLPDDLIIQKAAAAEIGLISARKYYLQSQNQGEFIFDYSQLDSVKINEGLKKLSQVLNR